MIESTDSLEGTQQADDLAAGLRSEQQQATTQRLTMESEELMKESTDSLDARAPPDDMLRSSDSLEPDCAAADDAMLRSSDSLEEPAMIESTDSLEQPRTDTTTMMSELDADQSAATLYEPDDSAENLYEHDDLAEKLCEPGDATVYEPDDATSAVYEPGDLAENFYEPDDATRNVCESDETAAVYEPDNEVHRQMTESNDSIEPQPQDQTTDDLIKMDDSIEVVAGATLAASSDVMIESSDSLEQQLMPQYVEQPQPHSDKLTSSSHDAVSDQVVPDMAQMPETDDTEFMMPTSLSRDSIELEQRVADVTPMASGDLTRLLEVERSAVDMSLSMESGGAWSQSSSVISTETLKSSDESRQDDVMAMSCDSPDKLESPPRTLSPQRPRSPAAKKQRLERRAPSPQNIYDIREQQRTLDQEANIDNRMRVPSPASRRRLSSDNNLNYDNRSDTSRLTSASRYSARSFSCTSYETPSTDSTYLEDERRHTKAMTYEPGVGKISYSAESAMGRGWMSRETVTKLVLEPEHQAPPAESDVTERPLTPLSRSSTPTDSSAHSDNCYCGPSRENTPLGSPMHRGSMLQPTSPCMSPFDVTSRFSFSLILRI